ncbi:NUDIX hydrolase [Arcanobacterium pinnipediorum]|uniref:NUDIX domain-containing protein n=1 Tax=Arcanobacterium pinnipediorum TaxID=1503041 RepID=A0ABY5ALN9_9ACTO|nr:NUDIX domain-containing protein [Arcanobacterium pinnipediorum]USR80159.1 NUDIX domain-containing protein [Arcanobacterium pinnipediorum]
MVELSGNDFEEWPLNDEGYPYRQAARVILLDSRNRIFLIRGHDLDDPTHTWWFTPGGGREGDESAQQAAIRELREETGLSIDVERLSGPVIKRSALFRFLAQVRKQDEEFFIVRLSEAEASSLVASDSRGWTALERKVLDEQRWWDLDELEKIQLQGQKVFPAGLVAYVRQWEEKWDGICHIIAEE